MLNTFESQIISGCTLTDHEKGELRRFSDAIKARDSAISFIALMYSRRCRLSSAEHAAIMTHYQNWLVFNEV